MALSKSEVTHAPTDGTVTRGGASTALLWEARLQQAALVLLRIGLAYLFFTQLWWKLPPSFGCPADFRFTTGTPAQLQRMSAVVMCPA